MKIKTIAFTLSILFTVISPFGWSGGSGTGGGNILENLKPTKEQVKQSLIKIWESHSIIKQIGVFNELYESYTKGGLGLRNILELRLPQLKNENFLVALKKLHDYSHMQKIDPEKVHLDFKPNEPCFISTGEERDGSFSIINQVPTICLSLLRITPKVDFINLRPKLEAILYHEISHIAKTTELEAEAIQEMAEYFLSPRELTKMSREEYEKHPLWLDCNGTTRFPVDIPYDNSKKSHSLILNAVGKDYNFHVIVKRSQDGGVVSAQGKLYLGKSIIDDDVITVDLVNRSMGLEYSTPDGKTVSIKCQPWEKVFYP